ncbi:TT1751-like protein [Trametes polyzona]|nr:TT1751-like protein [Trametes polyzona]
MSAPQIMPATKNVIEYTARRIIYDSPLPFVEIASRLERTLNKPAGGAAVFRVLGTAKGREEIEAGIGSLTDGRDFVYFGEVVHHRWLAAYMGASSVPQAIVYTFGNPLIAQAMLRHDLAAGLHIPPKLMLLEVADGSGTKIIYDDPASLISVPGPGGREVDDELQKAAEGLSSKVTALVQNLLE